LLISSAHLHAPRAHMGRTCRWAGEIELTPVRLRLNGSRCVHREGAALLRVDAFRELKAVKGQNHHPGTGARFQVLILPLWASPHARAEGPHAGRRHVRRAPTELWLDRDSTHQLSSGVAHVPGLARRGGTCLPTHAHAHTHTHAHMQFAVDRDGGQVVLVCLAAPTKGPHVVRVGRSKKNSYSADDLPL